MPRTLLKPTGLTNEESNGKYQPEVPEAKRFTRSNLDRIQTDPTSDSSYGRVPGGPTRPVYTQTPPLMKSGLFGPVRLITPGN